MVLTLRDRQLLALKQMINLNQQQVLGNNNAEPQWKVLIFDSVGQDIISPLLSVKDLHDLGVTLHLSMGTTKDSLPDVPAVYFVSPGSEQVERLCADLSSGLYDSYYFNFISCVPRQFLENLALSAVQNACVEQIKKVVDQYLNFISLEDSMFVLRKYCTDSNISFYATNRGSVDENQIHTAADALVDGLFSVCVTLGSVPIIRSPKGNLAELVAEKLDKRLRENLRDARNNLFTSDNIRAGMLTFHRPVLIIVDRSMDLATPLHHTWTYQAMAHDILDFELNRILLKQQTDLIHQKKREYDLTPHDRFWQDQKGNPFPVVAEAIQEELEEYRSSEDQIKRLKQTMGLDPDSDETISLLSDHTEKLTNTVSSLPQLIEKKRLLDMHTNVATEILETIKKRKLDEYFEAEEKFMNRQGSQVPLRDMIANAEFGLPEDKVRMFIVASICGAVPDTEYDSYLKLLEEAGCTLEALKFIRQWRSIAKMMAPQEQYAGGGTTTISMFSKLLGQGSQLVMEGVKNLVIKKHNLPLTRIVDAIMEMKALPETDDFRYFDPKLLRSSKDMPRNKTPFQDAIVFVAGGGNYIEYQNLLDYEKQKNSNTSTVAAAPTQTRRIVYGCSELVNASQFLEQLTRLGSEL